MALSMKWALLVAAFFVFTTRLTDYLRPSYISHKSGVVLVTGSSSGIGKSAALKLAKEGYTVMAGVRKHEDGNTLKEEAGRLGINLKHIIPVKLDVTSSQDIEDTFKHALNMVVKLHIPFVGLVCNAGFYPSALMPFEYSQQEIDLQTFSVNYFGVSNMIRKFLSLIRENKGRIVIVGSLAGNIARPFGQPYSASKFAVRSLSDSLRRELGPIGVSVSRIEPGYVSTPMLVQGMQSVKESEVNSFKSLPTQLTAPYEEAFDKSLATMSRASSNASSTMPTDQDIYHAIRAVKPHAVYYPGNVGGRPAYITAFVINILNALDPVWQDTIISCLGK